MELGFKRRSPRHFHRLQRGDDRFKRRVGFVARQLRIGLQRQQKMLGHPTPVTLYPSYNLGESLLALARVS